MTVGSENNTVRHVGDGVTVAFTINFSFQEVSHIKVFVDGVSVTTGFTITGGSPTGTLTFNTAPSNGADVFIRRVVPILQTKDYPTNDTFPSASHEAALDTLTYIAQQHDRDISLALSYPESLNITDATLPTPEDDKILAFDGVTGAIKAGPTTASFDTATNTAVAAAATATTQAGIATSAASTATTQAGLAEDSKDYAEEWAIKAEDSPVSVAAGGDGSTTFSARHWAAKAAAIVGFDLTADNTFTGNNIFQGIVDVTNINAETSSGGALRTSGGNNCITWGSGGSANSTLGGNMSGASTHKIVNVLNVYGIKNTIGSIGGGTQDIDLNSGRTVTATVDTSTTTFTFSNADPIDAFDIYLTNGGSQTINWPAAVVWAGGNAPTLTTSGVDHLVFTTPDGGTTWYGYVAGLDMS